MSPDEEGREHGIEFGPLLEKLENEEYPISNEDLLSKYGDHVIDLQDGEQHLKDVLDPLGETTFDSVEAVTTSITGMVSEEAIGRENYSDRGGETPNDERSEESI